MLVNRLINRVAPALCNSLKSNVTLSPTIRTQSRSIASYQPNRQSIPHNRHLSQQPEVNVSRTQRLKLLIKEYGPLAMGLYLTIGFISIGTCYAIINVGVNVEGVLDYFGMEVSKKTAGFSTLAAAYLVHKLLLPFRIGMTIGGVPPLARYLRKIGWMKPGSKQQKSN